LFFFLLYINLQFKKETVLKILQSYKCEIAKYSFKVNEINYMKYVILQKLQLRMIKLKVATTKFYF